MSTVSSSAALPVLVSARQVRLSAAHHEMLYGPAAAGAAGPAAALVDICPLPPSPAFATASVVDVRGTAGTLKAVRVVGPHPKQTEVRLSARDALAIGLSIGNPGLLAHASSPLDAGGGCTLETTRATIVLATGLQVGLRLLCVDKETARRHGLLEPNASATVLVRGERERELRDVPVAVVDGGVSWMEIEIDDANALEIGPSSTATIRA